MNTTLLSISVSLITSITLSDAHASPVLWTLCTNELELIETAIVDVNQNRIITQDDHGIEQSRTLRDLFFAHPTAAPQNPDIDTPQITMPAGMYVTLADGQTVFGTLADPSDPDHLQLTLFTGTTPRGDCSIDLEHIRSISVFPNFSRTQAHNDSDTITTINSDVLVGFIEAVGTTTTIATDHNTLNLSVDQIQSISFANPYALTEGVYLSTSDHMNLRVDQFHFDLQEPMSLSIDTDSLGLQTEINTTWLLPADAPTGIAVIHPNQRVISLSSISPSLIEPTGGRSWTPTPTVINHDANRVLSSVDLHSPVRVLYPIPEGSSRFACTLSGVINEWTDCDASIIAITKLGVRTELFIGRINADEPMHDINIQLPIESAHIEIRIDPGEHGPIQDRVIIEHPRLLIES